jgi:hypothetical protein
MTEPHEIIRVPRRVICLNQHRISETTNYCSFFGLSVSKECCEECKKKVQK